MKTKLAENGVIKNLRHPGSRKGFTRAPKNPLCKAGDESHNFARRQCVCRGCVSAVRGFTLVEVLITTSLMLLLATVLFFIYSWHSKTYSYQQAMVRVTETGRLTMQNFWEYSSQSHRILANLTLGSEEFTTATTTVIMQLPAIDSQGERLAEKWDYSVFYLDGKKLYQKVEPDALSSRKKIFRLLGDSVSELAFTYNSPDLDLARKITVDLFLEIQGADRNVSGRWQENFYLKNY